MLQKEGTKGTGQHDSAATGYRMRCVRRVWMLLSALDVVVVVHQFALSPASPLRKHDAATTDVHMDFPLFFFPLGLSLILACTLPNRQRTSDVSWTGANDS